MACTSAQEPQLSTLGVPLRHDSTQKNEECLIVDVTSLLCSDVRHVTGSVTGRPLQIRLQLVPVTGLPLAVPIRYANTANL